MNVQSMGKDVFYTSLFVGCINLIRHRKTTSLCFPLDWNKLDPIEFPSPLHLLNWLRFQGFACGKLMPWQDHQTKFIKKSDDIINREKPASCSSIRNLPAWFSAGNPFHSFPLVITIITDWRHSPIFCLKSCLLLGTAAPRHSFQCK